MIGVHGGGALLSGAQIGQGINRRWALILRMSAMGLRQQGQLGGPFGSSASLAAGAPSKSGTPVWNATRSRLAFAAGWLNP